MAKHNLSLSVIMMLEPSVFLFALPQALAVVGGSKRFITGERDEVTSKRNRQMRSKLTCPKKLVTIPGAGHLMEKPRMLQQLAEETIRWFDQYLRKEKMDPTLEYDIPDTEY